MSSTLDGGWPERFQGLELEEQSPGGLSLRCWRFYLMEDGFQVMHYSVRTRLSRNKPWTTQVSWNRLLGEENNMPAADIPFTPAIKAQVRAKLAQLVHEVPIHPPTRRR